jgi:hypothetical protein
VACADAALAPEDFTSLCRSPFAPCRPLFAYCPFVVLLYVVISCARRGHTQSFGHCRCNYSIAMITLAVPGYGQTPQQFRDIAGMTMTQMDVVEINEAFAVVRIRSCCVHVCT